MSHLPAEGSVCYLPHLPGQGGCSWYRGAYFVKLFVYDLFIISWSWNRWNCADNSLHTVLCSRRGVFGRSTAPRGCRDMVSCYSIYIYTCYIRIWYTHTIFCLFLVAHINTNPTPLCKRSYETPSLILISGSIFNQFFGWYPVHTSHCFLPWQPSFRLVFHQRPVSDASKPYTVTRSWGRPKQATVSFFFAFR